MFFRRSLPEEIACAEVLSAIALLLYRETAAISTVDVSSSHISRTAGSPKLQLGNEAASSTRQSELLIDLHQLDVEHEVAAYRAVAGIGESFGNPETALRAFDHQLQTLRPTRNDSIQPK